WVERPDTIWVEYKDIKGRQQKEKVHGFTARIFQHEIDHLHGILYTDRIPAGSLKTDTE
ncbi:MAG: peptide deformylase, partial [Lentimicrobiaceae bacterium]|nr:peptide deformylase [Lentimicrobiaceae bacterium]